MSARAARELGDEGGADMVLLIGPSLATCSIIDAFVVPVLEPRQG